MRTTLLAATAALVLSGSANAAFLLGSDANGHKQVINTDAPTAQTEVHSARIVAPAGPVDRAFMLGSDENGNKRVVNEYAEERAATWFSSYGTQAAQPQAIERGFLLGSDENGHKSVDNQYAR